LIVLFTDFGLEGPYVGQIYGVLARLVPDQPVINLFANAPAFNPKASSYLLSAYCQSFPADTVFIGVVDPGVGHPQRRGIVVQTDFGWFVGPDNGLFQIVAQRSGQLEVWEIDYDPQQVSQSFHGRDVFAPVAAAVARGDFRGGKHLRNWLDPEHLWPESLYEIIYIDHYGNAMTGIDAGTLPEEAVLDVNGELVGRARTFSDVAPGQAFWYRNANGLVEVAVNQERADARFQLAVGTPIKILR